MCCALMSPEERKEAEGEGDEVFACRNGEGCELIRLQRQLDAHDDLALKLHRYLARRSTQDLGLVPVVFEALQVTLPSRQSALDLLDRLEAIHSWQCPQMLPMIPGAPPPEKPEPDLDDAG